MGESFNVSGFWFQIPGSSWDWFETRNQKLETYYQSAISVPRHNCPMKPDEYPHQGITMHRIRFDGGFAGLVFTVGCMALFLAGLPVLWYPFIAALALGAAVALVLRIAHR